MYICVCFLHPWPAESGPTVTALSPIGPTLGKVGVVGAPSSYRKTMINITSLCAVLGNK